MYINLRWHLWRLHFYKHTVRGVYIAICLSFLTFWEYFTNNSGDLDYFLREGFFSPLLFRMRRDDNIFPLVWKLWSGFSGKVGWGSWGGLNLWISIFTIQFVWITINLCWFLLFLKIPFLLELPLLHIIFEITSLY